MIEAAEVELVDPELVAKVAAEFRASTEQLLRNDEKVRERLRSAMFRGMQPDPILTISEWAERYRYLPKEGAAEHGRWRNARTPFLVEIMDALSITSPVEDVTFQKGAQLGGTEVGNNFLLYAIDLGLGPTLALSKTKNLAERFAKQRFRPTIRDTPKLQGKISAPSKRDGTNTLLHVTFEGGQLMLANAEAAGGLRSMPIRNLFGDEIDSYPLDVDGEGDPCELAEARTRTYSRRKKLWVSTPTVEGESRIAEKFKAGDQRFFYVPCPHCGHAQVLVMKGLQFDRDKEGELKPETVRYECQECGEGIKEHHRPSMLTAGRWRPHNPAAPATVRSYHLSSLYSPWTSWVELARKYVAALKQPLKMKVFVNTWLGETFKEQGEAPDWERLYNRRETYKLGTVPKGGVVLTMGVDVQKDRMEWEVVAWGPEHESWSVDYGVFECDPTEGKWHGYFDELLAKEWPKEDGGALKIRKAAFDSGYQAQHVYNYTRTRRTNTMAVKGSHTQTHVVGPASKVDVNAKGERARRRRGATVHLVGVDAVKAELYTNLHKEQPAEGPLPAGWCHFPQHPQEYFKQLTAERVVYIKNRRGRMVPRWEPVRERNEALDCRVYARAAAGIVGIDRWTPEEWKAQAGIRTVHEKPASRRRKSTMHGKNKPWLTR